MFCVNGGMLYTDFYIFISKYILRTILEKEMATHSGVLAWEFHGQRSLEGYSPWGHKEWDMTEGLSTDIIYISYIYKN